MTTVTLLLSLYVRACRRGRGASTPLRPSTRGGERRRSPGARMSLLSIGGVLQVPFRTTRRTFTRTGTTTFSLPEDLFGRVTHW